MITPLRTAGFLLCLVGALALKGDPKKCSRAPKLSFNGVNPIEEARKAGKITVVALLDANCGYCAFQALLLHRMKKKFDGKGWKNITYMIINRKSAKGKKYLLQKDGFQVYESEMEDSWEKLNGSKDDFLIYNKCGGLAYHVKHPMSYLGWPYTKNAILLAYIRRCKKPCPEEKRKSKETSKSK